MRAEQRFKIRRSFCRHQRSWKNAEDEWVSKVDWHRLAFNRLGESVADTLHKGDRVLFDGQLVSSRYERESGKPKKAKTAKFAISWSVRANAVRRLNRAEAEVPAQAATPERASEDVPF
jgi:single-stranded DNA-binding protein